MRIDNTISTQVQKTANSTIKNQLSTEGTKYQTRNENVISSLKNDWKNKIRNIDLDIKELQNTLSKQQIKRELFIELQTELLSFSGDNKEAIEKKLNQKIDQYSFNNLPLYKKLHFEKNSDVYDLTAKLEIDKNKNSEDITKTVHLIKEKSIAKENLFFASTHIQKIDIKNSIDGQTKYIMSLAKDFKVNTDYLKKYFS